MEYLDIIYAQSVMNAVILSLDGSITEIKHKHPNRTDLINGMEKHLNSMKEALITVRNMDKQLRVMQSLSFNYHKENMELKFENNNLKEKCENLMNGL